MAASDRVMDLTNDVEGKDNDNNIGNEDPLLPAENWNSKSPTMNVTTDESVEYSDSRAHDEHSSPLSIRIENLTFAYPSHPDTPVLNNLSLEIDAGTSVAIVGGSGSGKSTGAFKYLVILLSNTLMKSAIVIQCKERSLLFTLQNRLRVGYTICNSIGRHHYHSYHYSYILFPLLLNVLLIPIKFIIDLSCTSTLTPLRSTARNRFCWRDRCPRRMGRFGFKKKSWRGVAGSCPLR